MLPLYEEIRTIIPEITANGHTGLWFQRFFDGYDQNWQVGKDKKQPWLQQYFTGKSFGNSNCLEQIALRQLALLKAINGQPQVFETDWHFITGMGNPHPVENGINWHQTAAVPYLSGAAVKGLIRSWLEVWEPQQDQAAQRQQLLKWFGSDHKDPNQQEADNRAGQLIFFDAIPIKPIIMQIDIMTPHMGKWYEQGGQINSIARQPESIPADWHNPVPIPYLVVKQAQFLFSVAAREPSTDQDIDFKLVMQALEQALNWLGAGAKTALGYGQMEPKTDQLLALQQLAEQRIIDREDAKLRQQMTPFERELDDICRSADNPPIALLQALEAGQWPQPDDQRIVALKVKAIWEKPEEKKWIPDFNGTNKQKLKQKQRCLLLQRYL